MIRAHFLDTDDYVFGEAERSQITSLATETEREVRRHLPRLRGHLNLVVTTGVGVIPETGEVGFAASPDVVNWKIDASYSVADVAANHLRHMLFHELHHCVRLLKFPTYVTEDWYDGSVFEGLATVFEREAGWSPPYGEYPRAEIEAWVEELFAQPVDHRFQEWKFEHADGRRWISYRVGTWVVERAIERSGRSAADLVWESTQGIIECAGLPYSPIRVAT